MGKNQKIDANLDTARPLMGGTAIRPPEYTTGQAIMRFFYNPDDGSYFSRTPLSWLLITIFYVVYYSCLALFWFGFLKLFFLTLPDNEPKYILSASRIGTNPGLGLRPKQDDSNIDSDLIRMAFNTNSSNFEGSANKEWAVRLNKFTENYRLSVNATRECADDDNFNENQLACRFDTSTLGACGQMPYGYRVAGVDSKVKPCLMLKPNRIFQWKPDVYTDEDLKSDDMPQNVKTLIRNSASRKRLWIDCQGLGSADVDALSGGISYFPPHQSIPFKYFPYSQTISRQYNDPVVAIQFNDLPVGQLIQLKCSIWTKGISHSIRDQKGLVAFAIMLI